MKRKKLSLILSLALAVFFGFTSCRSGDNEFDSPNIALLRDTINVEKTAGYSDISVQSNRAWTATTTADWITLSPASGNEGATSVRVSYLANDSEGAVDRSAEIILAVGRSYSKKLLVRQSGQITRTGLFVLTFGASAPSATPYPLFADYTDWGATGEGFLPDSTTFTGTGSLRQPASRLSSGYPNASAGSHAYLSNNQNIVIGKIDTKGANLFDITFGVSAYDGTSNNTFTIGQVDVMISKDGANWSTISYTYEFTPSGVATWGICRATCALPEGSERLYVKIAANASSGWQMRVDDITVLSRGTGTYNVPTVTTGQIGSIQDSTVSAGGSFTAPEGVTVTEAGIQYKLSGGAYTSVAAVLPTASFSALLTGLEAGKSYVYRAYVKVGTNTYYGAEQTFSTPSNAVYTENMGGTAVSGTTLVTAHSGWQKGGTGGANVTYEGNADVRTSSASPVSNGFSGGNNVFFGSLPRNFTVKNINISSATKYTLKFGIVHFSAATLTTDISLEGSLDGGTTWGPIAYTVSGGTDWQTATAPFSVPANSSTLALRFSANLASVMRVDDIELNTGGNGPLLDPVVAPVTPDTLASIASIRSMQTQLAGKGYPTTTSGQEYAVGAYRIKGRVVSKYDGTQAQYGNLNNRSIAIQDSTLANSGLCIRVASASSNTFALGDQVQVVLTGGKLSYYAGQLQVTLANDANITKTAAANQALSPTTITYADLISGRYECMYVAINNVQATLAFADGIKTLYNTTHTGNVIMENQAGDQFLMYSSSKVPFLNTVIPTGSGTLKGLGGIYVGTDTNYQIQPQVEADFSGLTGTRFGASGTLTYGTPFFKGVLNLGTALSETFVAIPYTYGSGQAVQASVAVSGPGAAGINAVSSTSYTLGSGADTLYIPITGTPTAAGSVTFTIGGLALTTNTVAATVIDASVEQFYAQGDTIVSVSMGGTGSGNAFTYPSGLKFEGIGGAANLSFASTYLSYATWDSTNIQNTYWLITIPAEKAIKDTVVVYATIQSSGTGPRDWTVKYSNNANTWYSVVKPDPVYASGNATATPVQFKIYIPEAQKVAANGKLYLKIFPSSKIAARAGTSTYAETAPFAPSGTNRFAAKFKVVKQ